MLFIDAPLVWLITTICMTHANCTTWKQAPCLHWWDAVSPVVCQLERAARLIALHQICQSTWLVPSKLIICRQSWSDQGRLLQHCLPASSTGLRHNVYERARKTTGNLSAYAVVLGHRLNLWSLSLYTVLPETHSSPLWKVLTSKLSSNKSASFIPSKVLHI